MVRWVCLIMISVLMALSLISVKEITAAKGAVMGVSIGCLGNCLLLRGNLIFLHMKCIYQICDPGRVSNLVPMR